MGWKLKPKFGHGGVMNTRISLLALASVFVVGTVAAQAQDPFVGTWKQNMAKSSYDPANLASKTGTTVKREASGSGYKLTTDGASAQGAATHTEYTTATLDGKDYPVKGSADYDAVTTKRINSTTLISVYKKGGTPVRMLRTVVSKDGKTSTSDQVGYNAQGVAYHHVTVFNKQ